MIEILGTIFFALAILHTFLVRFFHILSEKYEKGSVLYGVFHFLAEIEVVFGIWAALFLICKIIVIGWIPTVEYMDSLHFTEPLFVFAIMVLSATRPVLESARKFIQFCGAMVQKIVPASPQVIDICVLLILGPLSGSLITEPAAITVTALLLRDMLQTSTERMIYFLIAVLFVNISIGGALTPFAAPPILMVAKTWGWDIAYTFTHFGWKSMAAVIVNSLFFAWYFRKEISSSTISLGQLSKRNEFRNIPFGIVFVHFVFLILLVVTSHHPNIFMGLLLLFLGVATVTQKYQQALRLRESLLVAFFLAGIMVFGPFQKWWLQPLLESLSDGALFWSATFLTAVTDNAALTYLGTQVSGLSEASKYALVAGAIAGGGLTVIANAPNAAGYSILNAKFPNGSMSPVKLLGAALVPTLIACLFLFMFPTFN